MRIGASIPPLSARPLDVRVVIVNRLQAASHASSPTGIPVRPVDAAPRDVQLRRLSAHVLDVRA